MIDTSLQGISRLSSQPLTLPLYVPSTGPRPDLDRTLTGL